jgi:O-antigen/teichoic acid export membrane protein
VNLRLFGRNTIIYAIGNVGLRAASFPLIPLYAHSLPLEDYGMLMTLLLSIQLMLIIMNCGMRHAVVRFGVQYEREGRLSDLMGTSSLINVLMGLLVAGASLTVLVPLYKKVFHSDEVVLLVGMACCVSLFQSLSILLMSYYRAQNEAMKFMAVGIAAAGTLLATSYVLLFVMRMGLFGALMAKTITYAIILLVLSAQVFRKTRMRISPSLVPELLWFGFPLALAMSGHLIIGGASLYFLSLLHGLRAVAVYSLGHKLAQVMSTFIILPFHLSFQPLICANLDSPDVRKNAARIFTYLALAMALASFAILFGARMLLPLIAPPEYASAYLMILLLLPGMAFYGISNFGECLLSVARKTHVTGCTIAAVTVISLGLNSLLVRSMGWPGAVLATNVSYGLSGLALLAVALREFPLPIEWKRLCVAGEGAVSFLVVFFVVRDTNLILFGVTTVAVALLLVLLLFNSGFFYGEEVLVMKDLIHGKILKCGPNHRDVSR